MATSLDMQHTGLSQHETNEGEKRVTEADWTDLRRVPDKLPMIALLILVVEVCQITVDLRSILLN